MVFGHGRGLGPWPRVIAVGHRLRPWPWAVTLGHCLESLPLASVLGQGLDHLDFPGEGRELQELEEVNKIVTIDSLKA